MPTKPTGRKRGNPNFVKGHTLKCGGRKPNIAERIPQCAEFMEKEGWKELMWLATYRGRNGQGTRNQVPASNLLAAYGYGKPSESLDLTSGGNSVSIADFLTAPKTDGASGTD